MILILSVALFATSALAQDTSNQIAFSAGLSHDLTLLHAETVVYDKVFTNLGNGYNESSGVFTSPINGIFVFQFHTLAHLDKSTWLELYHNGNYIASVYGHTATDYASAGNSVVLNLKKGDTVEVKAVDNSYGVDTNLYGQPDEVYTTFSGYLIAPVYSEVPAVGK